MSEHPAGETMKITRNWNQIVVDAVMHRITQPPPDETTMCVKRVVFDELVEIAQLASHANGLLGQSNIDARHSEMGWQVVVTNNVIPAVSAEERTLVEALATAAFGQRTEIDRLTS